MNPDSPAPTEPQTPNPLPIEPAPSTPITPIAPAAPATPTAPNPVVPPSTPVVEAPVVVEAPAPIPTPVPMPAPVEAPNPVPSTTSTPAPMMDVAAPTPITQPVVAQPIEQAGGIIVGGISPAELAASPAAPRPSGKKKLLLLIGLPLLLIGLAAGGVFGLYLPNTPNAVWNTGVTRTGTAVDKLVTAATDQKQLSTLNTSELTGTLDATYPGGTVSGDLTATFDKSNLNSGLNVKFSNEGKQQALSAKVLSKTAQGATYPDVYFQLSGYSALGLDSFLPGINAYDGKWIVADSAYIKSIGEQYTDDQKVDSADISSADIAEISNTVSKVTQEYIFTTDSDKAVLVQKSFVDKETIDGVKTNHYKATIDEANAKEYCNAVSTAVLSTKAYKNISGADAAAITKAKTDIAKSCAEFKKPTKDLDVWIGGKYKLIQKIRVYDDTSSSYVDIGQKYTGGDDLTLFTKVVDPTAGSTLDASMTTDVKSYKTSFNVSFKSKDYTIKAALSAKSSDKKVVVPVPSNPIKVQDIMTALNGAGTMLN